MDLGGAERGAVEEVVFFAFEEMHLEFVDFFIFDHDFLLVIKQILLNAFDLIRHAFLHTPLMLKLMHKFLNKFLKLNLHRGVKLVGLLLLVLVKSTPGTVVVVMALSWSHVETGTGLGAVAGCRVLVVMLVVGGVVGG